MKTPTRSDYMNGRATHQGYYGAIVREAGISLATWHALERVKHALAVGDEHLNTIPLKLWDELAYRQRPAVEPVLREHGDFWSLAGGVCVAKEAARQAAQQ